MAATEAEAEAEAEQSRAPVLARLCIFPRHPFLSLYKKDIFLCNLYIFFMGEEEV